MGKEELIEGIRQLLEDESCSCSMEPLCVTPEYIYRIWEH